MQQTALTLDLVANRWFAGLDRRVWVAGDPARRSSLCWPAKDRAERASQ